ncbi:MAG: hypothetical protein RIF46_04090 [Cyclobacteriaceae bacterium]
MSDKLKSTLRIISVLMALIVVAMYFGFLPFIDVVDEFYVMVIAYALLLATIK